MKIALSLLALLGAAPPVTIPVSDKFPVLNVEALCKASVEDDKANGLADAQSFSDCMKDETQAQQQVSCNICGLQTNEEIDVALAAPRRRCHLALPANITRFLRLDQT